MPRPPRTLKHFWPENVLDRDSRKSMYTWTIRPCWMPYRIVVVQECPSWVWHERGTTARPAA
jgi:hypothetical protein